LESRKCLPGSRVRLEIRPGVFLGLAALLFLGCARLDSSMVGHYPGDLALQDWRTIAKLNRPARGEILRIVDAGRSDTLSNHIVVIQSHELPHRHNRHDATVVLLQGRGTIVIGKERRQVRPGAVLFIPRGTIHHFTNTARGPSVALVVFAPPFDGKDREILYRPPAPAGPEPLAPSAEPEGGVVGEGVTPPGGTAAKKSIAAPAGPPDAGNAPEAPREPVLPGKPTEGGALPDRPRSSPGAVIGNGAAPGPEAGAPAREAEEPAEDAAESREEEP
jgi:mannose-6-phosphate isomerase-like protein (cupin superfamily)